MIIYKVITEQSSGGARGVMVIAFRNGDDNPS